MFQAQGEASAKALGWGLQPFQGTDEGQRQPQWLDPGEGRAGEGREQVESQVARASDGEVSRRVG